VRSLKWLTLSLSVVGLALVCWLNRQPVQLELGLSVIDASAGGILLAGALFGFVLGILFRAHPPRPEVRVFRK